MLTSDAVGGVWTYATVLARELCRRSCDVTLVVLGPSPRPDQLKPLQVSDVDVVVTGLALEWEDPAGLDTARAREQLVALEQRVRPDVVHLNGYREAAFGWTAPVLVVAHSCVRSWWLACRRGEPTEERWQRYIAGAKEGLAAANAWVAPTRAFRDEVQALYEPPSSGRVVHNGIAAHVPCQPKESLILAAGRMWDEAKNLSALAAIAPDMAWPVHVAGPLNHATTPARPPTARNLSLLGEVGHADLLGLMERAAIYVAPAVYEPFGLTVLEAAASGCALVLSDIPSFRELWRGAAVFIPPRDQDRLRAVLQRLCAESAQRKALQRAALQRARRYQASTMADRYLEIYLGLTGIPGSVGRFPREDIPAEAPA